MRKKTILSIGALTLATGLGLAAMGSANLLPIAFSASVSTTAEAAPTYMTLKSSVPVNGADIPLWQAPKTITLEYTDANPGTFGGILVNNECTEPIRVMKCVEGGDPVEVLSINATQTTDIKINKTNPSLAEINVSSVTWESGAAGYDIVVPAGLFNKDVDSGSLDSEGNEVQPSINRAVTIHFTLNDNPRYATTPVSGATVNTANGGLNNVSVTWEAEGSLAVNGTKAAELYYVDQTMNSRELRGTYEPSVDGMTLNLTLKLAEGVEKLDNITAGTKGKYYEIVIPAGYVDVKGTDGSLICKSDAINIDNLLLQYVFNVDDIEVLEPEGVTEFTPATFPREIVLYFPIKIDIVAKNKLYANPYIYRRGSSTLLGQYTAELQPNGQTLILTMQDMKDGEIKNRPEEWFDGEYYLKFNMQPFMNAETQELLPKDMQILSWTFTGGSVTDNVAVTKINAVKSYYLNEAGASVREVPITSDSFNNIPADPGFGSIQLQFYWSTLPQDNGKKAYLYKDGQAEPIWEQTNNGKWNNGQLWNGSTDTPSATAKESTTAGKYANFFYNITDDVSPAKTGKRDVKRLTEPGTYRLVVEEGFFAIKQSNTPANPSPRIEIPFTITGNDIAYDVTPAAGSVLKEINEFKFTYPEGAVVDVPEGTTVKIGGLKNAIEDNKYKDFYTLDVKGEGNVVTVYAKEPFATPYAYGYKLEIPANTWSVTYGGSTQKNRQMDLNYTLKDLSAGKMTPAPGETPIAGTSLGSLTYLSNALIKDAGSAAVTLYAVTELDFNGAIQKDRKEIATYTFTNAPKSENGDAPVKECILTTNADLSSIGGGKYEVEIPVGAFTYSNGIVQDEAFVFEYVVKAPAFSLSSPANDTPSFTSTSGVGLARIEWMVNEFGVALGSDSAPVVLDFNGTTLAELPASSVAYMAPMDWEGTIIPGSVTFVWPEGKDYNQGGVYTVKVPEGFFTLNGEPMAAFNMKYTYDATRPAVDFTYTLNPIADSTVETLEEITLRFDNATQVNAVADGETIVATLENEDGTEKYECVYAVSDYSKIFTFYFGTSNTEWKNGKYTLKIPAGILSVDQPDFTGVAGNGNFEGLTANYTLNAVQMESIKDHITYSVPDSAEGNPANTTTNWGVPVTAMGIIGLGVDTKDIAGVPGSEWVSLEYSPTVDGEYTLLNLVNPVDELTTIIMNIALTAEGDGLLEFPAQNYIYFLFANDGQGGLYEQAVTDVYSKDGYYKLVIPTGSFAINGRPLKGCEVVYHYSNELPEVDMAYTITPSENYTFTNFKDLAYDGSGIQVKFDKARVAYAADGRVGKANLEGAEGTIITSNTPSWVEGTTNALRYTFGSKDIEKTPLVNGTYTFVLPEGAVGIDFEPDWGEKGNSKEIRAVFHLEDQTLGVALIGIGAADSYSVFTLDGKLLKLNAAIEELKDLEPGMYIVNGKKVMLRK